MGGLYAPSEMKLMVRAGLSVTNNCTDRALDGITSNDLAVRL